MNVWEIIEAKKHTGRTHCPTCVPVTDCCDHCKHYSFNGDEHGSYTGNGFCNLHQLQVDPEGECDSFYCSLLPIDGTKTDEPSALASSANNEVVNK